MIFHSIFWEPKFSISVIDALFTTWMITKEVATKRCSKKGWSLLSADIDLIIDFLFRRTAKNLLGQ